MPATNEVDITINDKKSDLFSIRGTATVDGIRIPFTAYRKRGTDEHPGFTGPSDIQLVWLRVVVRSKDGILRGYSNKEYIETKICNAAKGWWIDRNLWR